MYCVKCKTKTETLNPRTVMNNKNMLQGKCVVCGISKSQFQGKGVINKMINNLPIETWL